MAKATTAISKFKVQRALGIELPGLGKAGALARRPYRPGVHGNSRRKISDYAIRLQEKQKLRFHYGLREKQLVKYVKQAKRDKTPGVSWIDTLVITLESRLNNVIFRLGFAPSIPAASQMVAHGQVLVNGKKVDKSSFIVKKGDVITLSEKGYNNQAYKMSVESPRLSTIPACFNVEGTEKKKATMIDAPLATDIPFEFNSQLVIERYYKVK